MLLSAVALVATACQTGRSEVEGQQPEQPEQPVRPHLGAAPDFTLPTANDGTFTLSNHRGEVVILNFWATWCAPCIIEVPELVALQKELADQGVLVVGISQDTGSEALGEVREFQERFRVNYPLVLDADLAVGGTYGVHSLPTTMVVDRDGEIRKRKLGLVKRSELLQMLDGLIELPAEEESEVLAGPPPDDATGAWPGEPDDVPVVAAVSAEEAGALFEAGVMVIDLRSYEERASSGEIPFSLAIALEHIDRSALPANMAAPVVFLASDDETAWQAATLVASWGYVYAHPVIGGFEAWRAAGLPVEHRPTLSQGL